METSYKVIQETYTYVFCKSCSGTGEKMRQFRGERYISSCAVCMGTGRQRITRRTEVPLIEALRALNEAAKNVD